MNDAQARECHYCHGQDLDVRPYGPGGAWVCFPCAMATPEREAQIEAAFGALLDAAGAVSPLGVAVIDACEPSSSGPQPLIDTEDF